MRILWSSNAIWANTGYGIQAKYLLPEFQKLGHEVAQHAWYGLMGGVLNWGGMPIYPAGMDPYGNDIIDKHAEHFKADIVISLMDVWVLHQYGKKNMRWIPYMPIDHDPIPPKVLSALDGAFKVVSYAKYGEDALNRAGIPNTMIPHGVDCSTYKPADKRAAKQNLGFDPDAFVIGMVGANKGVPSRKCFAENLQAVARFKTEHPGEKIHLYLHTLEGPEQQGLDLNLLLQNLGFQPTDVTFCNQYKYISGMLGHEYMAEAYNAMDVLLGASMSEGFGIPLIEAQACGTPVITGDYTSMRELVFTGAAVPYAQRYWTPLNAWNYLPSIEAIVKALEVMYERRGNAQMRETARAGALAYDWPVIVAQYWRPFLEEVEQEIRSGAPAAHVHRWYTTGLYDETGALCVPCKTKTCESEMRVNPDGTRVVKDHAFKSEIHGVPLDIEDDPDSGVWKIVLKEIEREYDFDSIPFQAGDVVLDLGAHVGIVSMYLAKKYPFLQIHAFEPVKSNYERLLANLARNEIVNVRAHNEAVTGDGRSVQMKTDPRNSGGATLQQNRTGSSPSRTLADILQFYEIHRVKLLKIDVEGAEYEILSACPELLNRVDHLRGELHGVHVAEVEALTECYLGDRAKWTGKPKVSQAVAA